MGVDNMDYAAKARINSMVRLTTQKQRSHSRLKCPLQDQWRHYQVLEARSALAVSASLGSLEIQGHVPSSGDALAPCPRTISKGRTLAHASCSLVTGGFVLGFDDQGLEGVSVAEAVSV